VFQKNVYYKAFLHYGIPRWDSPQESFVPLESPASRKYRNQLSFIFYLFTPRLQPGESEVPQKKASAVKNNNFENNF
jgi:hypothetical protein